MFVLLRFIDTREIPFSGTFPEGRMERKTGAVPHSCSDFSAYRWRLPRSKCCNAGPRNDSYGSSAYGTTMCHEVLHLLTFVVLPIASEKSVSPADLHMSRKRCKSRLI